MIVVLVDGWCTGCTAGECGVGVFLAWMMWRAICVFSVVDGVACDLVFGWVCCF